VPGLRAEQWHAFRGSVSNATADHAFEARRENHRIHTTGLELAWRGEDLAIKGLALAGSLTCADSKIVKTSEPTVAPYPQELSMTLRRLLLSLALAGAGAAVIAQTHTFKVAEISIGHPYARATAPGQPSGGAYLRLENRGPDDRLLGASADVSAGVELHMMKMEGDVMRMRQVDAIDVPSNKPVVLEPGGLHLMLVGLKAPLKEGSRFPMTLKFEKAGDVQVEVSVEAVKPMKH
jgi:copper(I)-binding protein